MAKMEIENISPCHRAAMEKRYGARQLSTMAANYLSESYKSTNAKPCPNCRAPIEKSDGCNKMTCFKCQGRTFSEIVSLSQRCIL